MIDIAKKLILAEQSPYHNMKKKLLLFFIASLFYASANAQDFVTYTGDIEKSLISSAQTPDDFIKLALSSELSDIESPVIYNKFLQDFKSLGLGTMVGDKSERHLKKIYQVVHDHFLKKYNPGAHFGDFILNGEYNDVSASILYAYTLEILTVPYRIKQFPAHVYVIANPGTDNITFETIDQSKGYYMFDDQSKVTNVTEMIKEGYLDQSYVIRVGVERAFDDFLYGQPDVDLKETIGILYFEKAMLEAQANENAAYSDISKADMLFPDKKNVFFENRLLMNMADNFTYDDLKDWRALTRLANNRYATDNIKRFLEGQFENFLNAKLINGGQKDKASEVYNYLHSNLTDTAVKKVVTTDYFFISAHYAYITNDYEQALNCLEIAYPLNPNNPLIASDFVQMILHKYSREAPSAESLSDFDKYMDGYPLLKNNPIIISIYLNDISMLCIMGFAQGNGITGDKYLQMLIHQLDAHPDNENKNERFVANAFAAASVYYFRKQAKQKAIAVLNQGLKYEPQSDVLLRKLKADTGN